MQGLALLLSPLVLFGLVPSPPPPCGVGPVVFLVGPAPPVGGQWLLPLVSSNVIVTCLVPSPPVGWGLWSFWLAPPRLCGAVCSTKICMVWLMSSLRARYHTKLLFSPCKRCPCPCSDAVHSPSSPPSGLRGFVPVVRDRWEEHGGWGPGRGGGYLGGGGGVGARDPRHIYVYIYIYIYRDTHTCTYVDTLRHPSRSHLSVGYQAELDVI